MPGKWILVVEDDQAIADVVGEVLVDAGYQAVLARDGADALGQLAALGEPSVILLDLLMPRLNGREFLGLRGQRYSASIPIVAFSAVPHELVATGQVDAVLPKPCDLDELAALVRRFSGAAPEPA